MQTRACNRVLLVYKIGRRVNENGHQPWKIISPAAQQEKTSLRRDRHSNFVIHFKAGTTFEPLFGEKNLNVIEKFSLVRSRKPGKERNSAFNYLQPLIREMPRLKLFSASFFQKAKDHR